ncbi:IMS-domain-containing protein [Ramaria rubella]|nr:IMS-domain-containing protein [Ramaria rubella]
MEASLVTRLAGPSTGKAGLAKDQTEINRIIAEASKGSKFYDNEKRKDEELTEKIKRLLKHRDEVSRGIDIGKLEACIDKTLVELEATRDLTQYIVHVDMDAFFAAVELLDNPNLKGRPFGVGGGVLTTASYDARQYGVRSGMPGFIAKKLCPHIILVPIRPGRYGEMSRQVMDVFRRYDLDMQAAGADEAFLNITSYCQTRGLSADDCVQKLRAEVHSETNLTVSAGIAPNKICSDKNKPNGQFHLPFDRDAIIKFMHDLPIRKIPGIGRVTERLLASIGVVSCGDVFTFRATLSLLDKQFHLNSLLLTHLGIASNIVKAGQREERKSVGSERTFRPISDKKQIIAKLESCAVDLEEDMGRTGWAGRTITLKYKLDTYQVFTRAKSSTRYINRKEDLFAIGKGLLMPELPLTIRLIGLRVTKLKDLRAPDEPGLKRFFELGRASPNKKRQKLDHVEDQQLEDSGHALEEEQAMAEYEDDPENHIAIDNDEIGAVEPDHLSFLANNSNADAELGLQRHHKPESLSAAHTSTHNRLERQAQPGANTSSSNHKPKYEVKSKSKRTSAVSTSMEEQQTCPICAKEFNTDNAGLNEHIDFCLSKGAIFAATAVPNDRHQ